MGVVRLEQPRMFLRRGPATNDALCCRVLLFQVCGGFPVRV